MPDIYFEDFAAGQVYELGSRMLDRDAIIDFATEFDPQLIHVDEEAATKSIYGGLIAGTLVFQGLNSFYYFTRRKHLEAYLIETPEWVVELQRRGVAG